MKLLSTDRDLKSLRRNKLLSIYFPLGQEA